MSKLNNQGITLLEAMITIVVIMIGVLILANILAIQVFLKGGCSTNSRT